MDRCALSIEFHHKGYNCCQSVLAACSDMTGLSEKDSLAIGGGFGRGMGTTREVCGALSGAMMALSLMFPHIEENDAEAKQRSYHISRVLQDRFARKFGHIHCRRLLDNDFVLDDRCPAAKRLKLEKLCEVYIVTAVELVEELSAEFEREYK